MTKSYTIHKPIDCILTTYRETGAGGVSTSLTTTTKHGVITFAAIPFYVKAPEIKFSRYLFYAFQGMMTEDKLAKVTRDAIIQMCPMGSIKNQCGWFKEQNAFMQDSVLPLGIRAGTSQEVLPTLSQLISSNLDSEVGTVVLHG